MIPELCHQIIASPDYSWFLKSCEKLAWIAKRFQSEYQMLKFAQARTTEVAGFVIVRCKNAFLENTPASVLCDGLAPGLWIAASGA
jgi:hypothetical protein